MATTEEELKSFSRFVKQRLGSGENEPSLAELFDLWMLENRGDTDYAENLAAINASIEDFKRGQRGRPAGETSRELRVEFGLTDE